MIVPKDKIGKLIVTVGSTVIITLASKILEEHEGSKKESVKN